MSTKIGLLKIGGQITFSFFFCNKQILKRTRMAYYKKNNSATKRNDDIRRQKFSNKYLHIAVGHHNFTMEKACAFQH